MKMTAIGIDLGGTDLKGTIVDQKGEILARRVRPTDLGRGPDAVADDMIDLIDRVLADASVCRSDLAGVGVGSPGSLSIRTGRIIRAPNLPVCGKVPPDQAVFAPS